MSEKELTSALSGRNRENDQTPPAFHPKAQVYIIAYGRSSGSFIRDLPGIVMSYPVVFFAGGAARLFTCNLPS